MISSTWPLLTTAEPVFAIPLPLGARAMRCYPGRYPESALPAYLQWYQWLNARRPSSTSHAATRAGPPRPAFPAFLAGAGRPLLPSMIDYSVFSLLAAARGSTISGPISRSATAFNFCIQGQIRPLLHLVNGSQGVRGPFRVTPPLVPGERPGFP